MAFVPIGGYHRPQVPLAEKRSMLPVTAGPRTLLSPLPAVKCK